MNYPFRDSLVVEMCDFFAKSEILEKRRSSHSSFGGVLIVRYSHSGLRGLNLGALNVDGPFNRSSGSPGLWGWHDPLRLGAP